MFTAVKTLNTDENLVNHKVNTDMLICSIVRLPKTH